MSYIQRIAATATALAVHTWDRVATDDRGEGVISSAIAVLVMALLGA